MTTLREISEKLNKDKDWDFFPNMMDIDIGDYTFTDVKQYDNEGFVFLYSNKNNPKVKLFFNEDRQAVELSILEDDGMVKATTWRLGKKFTKKFPKEKYDDVY